MDEKLGSRGKVHQGLHVPRGVAQGFKFSAQVLKGIRQRVLQSGAEIEATGATSVVVILSLTDSQVSFREAIAEELWQTGLKAREAGAWFQTPHCRCFYLNGDSQDLNLAFVVHVGARYWAGAFASPSPFSSRKPQNSSLAATLGREDFGESTLRCQRLGPRAGPQRFPPPPTGTAPNTENCYATYAAMQESAHSQRLVVPSLRGLATRCPCS